MGPIPRAPWHRDPPLRTVDIVTGEQGPTFEPMGSHDHGTSGSPSVVTGRSAARYGYQFVGDGAAADVCPCTISKRAEGGHADRPHGSSDDSDFQITLNRDGSQVAVRPACAATPLFDTRDGRLLVSNWPAEDDEPRRRVGGHVVGGVVTGRQIVRGQFGHAPACGRFRELRGDRRLQRAAVRDRRHAAVQRRRLGLSG